MKNCDNYDEKCVDDDGVDDEIDDEDTRERYPFLFDGEEDDDDKDETVNNCTENAPRPIERTAEHNKIVREAISPRFVVRNSFDRTWLEGPNYHYLNELSEEHLPNLNYYRIDNFFASRPAHGFFIDSDMSPPRLPCLFGEYWLKGEIAVLFADTAAGKSILATQIAQSIASGVAIAPLDLNVPAQRVAYFDLELSREQFDRRYSNDDISQPAKFPFHRNLIRNQPHPFEHRPDGFIDETDFIVRSMIGFIEFSKAKVVVIDNITWLNNASQIGNAAQRIMKGLSRIKREMNLSILVLAHTPKRRVRSPLTINDLQGSKAIANFADSIFGIGRTRFGDDLRYLKSIKRRSTGAEPDNKVSVFRIQKDVCFLNMSFQSFSDERDHIGWLNASKELERLELIERAVELYKEGKSQREMARRLGVSPATINRCLKEAEE